MLCTENKDFLMNLVIKTAFLGILAALFVSFFGNDIVDSVGDQQLDNGGTKSPSIIGSASASSSIQIPIQGDGHYWVNMNVNYNDVNFIVDTGASFVTLSHEDAKKLSLNLFENDYKISVNTAAGRTTMAEVTLDMIKVGGIELRNVKAFVAREGMLTVSLLGMNYLNRLNRFEFSDQKLIFEQ
jgi:aspartyl protease family protein